MERKQIERKQYQKAIFWVGVDSKRKREGIALRKITRNGKLKKRKYCTAEKMQIPEAQNYSS